MKVRQFTPPRGFTMLELIVVILIIIVLASLLLPAVIGALRARDWVTQVDDMKRIQAGLDAFKSRYGVYPPSRIRLREGTAYNTNEGFDAHSLKMLKRIWPSFNPVTIAGPSGDANTAAVPDSRKYLWCFDNPNKIDSATGMPMRANWTGTYELEGDECLVFFLGGIAQFDRTDPTSTIVLHGFTKRPNDPSGVPTAGEPATVQRDTPLVEFDVRRLFVRDAAQGQVALPPTTCNAGSGLATCGHAFPGANDTEYLSANVNGALKLPSYFALGVSDKEDRRPFAYFSGYDGMGYRPDDFNLPSNAVDNWFEALEARSPPLPLTATDPAWQQFQCKFLAPAGTTYRNCQSMAPNPYCSGEPVPSNVGVPINWRNPNGYQLISPGSDGKYGPGGQIPRPKTGTENPGVASYVDMTNNGSSYDNATNVSESARLGEFNERQSNL